ncbi:ORF115 [Agrotis segetum granulovirus]|uniref:ORF115 n=1 Tax=Agrotis segetum granulosis virus TaxID=10464 RepID=Q6QXH5_GVAS|nr:ORF115 [Agrotis segetum granulovirus]
MDLSNCGFTDEQLKMAQKYCMENYVTKLKPGHKNTKEEIFELERATRGQCKNNLWKLLRVNRTTATKSTGSSFYGESVAMKYGIEQEEWIKQQKHIMDAVCEGIEGKLKKKVKERVLNCGLFLSPLGIYSASPDAYFVLENEELVVLEIKCPYTYKSDSMETIRRGFNNRSRYRIPHTAFSINKNGPIDVRVEKKNDHYRQMQAQLYITGAVLAVYLVKIGDVPEIHFVERDIKQIQELKDREEREFNNHVRDNSRNNYLVLERNRKKTFPQNGAYSEEKSKLLARQGFYYNQGCVVCYFCKSKYETSTPFLEMTHSNCDKTDNISHVDIKFFNYINQKDRVNNLNKYCSYDYQQCIELANQGFFYDPSDNTLKLFCCGEIDKHSQKCDKNGGETSN